MSNPAVRTLFNNDFLTFKEKRKNIWTKNVRLLKPEKLQSSVISPIAEIFSTHNSTAGAGVVANHTADFGDFRASGGYSGVLQTTIQWDTNRKIRYHPAAPGAGDSVARDTWIPYSYIYVPQEHQEAMISSSDVTYNYPVTEGATVTHSYRDLVNDCSAEARTCHWFSDS